MFRLSLKTAFRNLLKRRAFGSLNIAGLSIGITCAAFIRLWVEDEMAFDHNFALHDHLYRIIENEKSDQGVNTMMDIPGEVAGAVKTEIPGIKNSARVSFHLDELAVIGDKKIRTNGLYADTSFLSMFTINLLRGDRVTALGQPQSVVISQSLARACFGDEDPLGKTIRMNAGESYSVDGLYKVTGVFADLPANCSFRFQWLSPYTTWENFLPWVKGWSNPMAETYVQLEPSASPAAVQGQLTHYLAQKVSGQKNTLYLWSMNDWHLRGKIENGVPTDSVIRYVRLFSLIAIAILLIACINFMNLSTARSEQRAREVGVLKVVGAGRRNLITKFIGESLLLSFLAVGIAIGLLYLLLPLFNTLVNKHLDIHLLQPAHLIALVTIAIVTGLLSGSYPAFYLSSFNPIYVLKGLRIKSGGAVAVRRGLVITQFAASVGLIIGTVIIYQQVQHIKQRDIGYTRDNLIYLALHGAMKDHFEALKDKLLATGYVENAAVSLHDALNVYSSNTGGISWQGKDPNSHTTIHINGVSPEYISTMHMQLIAGRDFYSAPGMDSVNVIINQSLARLMGKEGRVGGILTGGPTNFQVVGIIRDVVYNDIYGPSAPLMLLCNPRNVTSMAIRFKSNADMPRALGAAGSVITAESPDQPFAYKFADVDFDELFTAETLIGKLSGIFAVLAILISCLGLFGLAAYTAERRLKEIGIRKVLGASARGLTGLLLREFVQLVTISCIIAFPLAFWILHGWLGNYEYRTTIHWWVFGLAGALALVIAVLTVGFQAVRAAMANPIKALRSE